MRLIAKLFGLFLAASVTLVAPQAQAGEDDVWFFVWHSTVPKSVQDGFRSTHDVGLVVDTFMVADEAEARLAARGTEYDLAVVPVEILPRLIDIGAVQPFDPDQVKTEAAAHPDLVAELVAAVPQAADHAMPFLWGTTGLVFNRDKIDHVLPNAPKDSWELLFNPQNAAALSACGISIVDSVQEVVSITLLYLGRNPNSTDKGDLDAAFETLARIMPYVRSIGGEQQEELLREDACLALTWSTDALSPMLNAKMDELAYVVPKEGTALWADVLVSPGDTHHTEHTYKLLSYLYQPEILAEISAFSLALTDVPIEHSAFDGVSLDTLERVAPKHLRDRLFMLTPRTGAEKRDLDKRWRRLQLGL